MTLSRSKVVFASILFMVGLPAAFAQPSAFLGFENPTDVNCFSGDGTITRVPSGGGFYHVASYDGNFHAEITNLDDAYQNPGFGDSKFTEFCLAPSGYQGDFSQNVAVYINAHWPAAAQAGTPSFWIDESPRDASGAIADGAGAPSSTFTAEHNFRFTATGTTVLVGADDQPAFATITQSGWYLFQMTWRKDPVPTNPVLTDFNIYNQLGVLVGTTTRPAFMVGAAPPLLSNNLGGSGYLWFTVWQNGFANDVLAIDDASVGGLGAPAAPALTGIGATLDGSFQVKTFSNLGAGDSFINVGNTGASSAGVGPFGSVIGGNVCVNVYVFSPDEQEVACCTCFLTPNAVQTVSTRQLISKTLTPAVPTAITVKLLSTFGGTSGSTCNAARLGDPAMGLIAFGTNIHAAAVGGSNASGTFAVTETPFIPSTLSTAEYSRLTTLCGFIAANGTGFGICPGCTLGAAGAVRQ